MSSALKSASAHVLEYGPYRIPFTIDRADRQRLRIDVHPDQRVVITAPRDKEMADILGRIKARASWVFRQMRHFERFQPLPGPRRHVSGETHLYLGRQYRLKIRQGSEENVKLIGQHFVITAAKRGDPSRIKTLLENWYKAHATVLFQRHLDELYGKIKRYGIKEPTLKVRKMTKRWGSCTGSKAILLNIELVKAPMHCIEYVIMHEICHLLVPKHGEKFRRVLSRCMPDWERRKQRLYMVVL